MAYSRKGSACTESASAESARIKRSRIKSSLAESVRTNSASRILLSFAAMLMCVVSAFCMAACTSVNVTESSPRVSDVSLNSTSEMTEGSQRAEIKLVFDQNISAESDVLADFTVLLNGSAIDEDTVILEAVPSANAITFVLRPVSDAYVSGAGSYFALYQSNLTIESARADGALPSITGADGSTAVLEEAVQATVPSGLTIEVLEQVEGSTADGVRASTVFQVTSPALIRAITWFSPDGGQTKLLKHNHLFASASAEDCAADLASVINGTSGLGITASVDGSTVVLSAVEVVDGQRIDPLVVEGVGVEGGTYSADDAMEEGQ